MPTTGLRKVSRSTTARGKPVRIRVCRSGGPYLKRSSGARSSPAQKARPSPRSTSTRTAIVAPHFLDQVDKAENHLRIEGVELVGTIEGDRADGTVDIETDPVL
jgi:hypothetical protein